MDRCHTDQYYVTLPALKTTNTYHFFPYPQIQVEILQFLQEISDIPKKELTISFSVFQFCPFC